ncbi:MAG: helix-turn-helix domain-containing protein [Bacteroidota bacterium]
MNNPFEILFMKMDKLEKLILENNQPVVNLEPENKPLPHFTTDGLADFLHITKPTVYSKHSKGELPGAFKRGKRLYFDRQIILDWLKEERTKSSVEIKKEAEEFLTSQKQS